MLDAALIQQCADPSLKPAVVEQFIEAAGSTDPLAVTVKSGGRLVLVPKADSPEKAMEIIRENVGRAVVRVGVTQFPAGIGVKDVSELKPELVDPCANLRIGTAMFAKILRIVTKWYGNPTTDEVFPQIFEDAIHSWKTGEFEGESVFQAKDPGGRTFEPAEGDLKQDEADAPDQAADPDSSTSQLASENAGIRIDLSRIGGQK